MKAFFIFLFSTAVLLSAAAQERPDASLTYRTGRDLEARGRVEEANNYYNDAVRICLDEIVTGTATMDTYAVLTWTLQRQGKYSDVVRWGSQALRIRDDFRIVETMGEAYFYLKDYNAALKNMQRYTANLPRGDRASVAYLFIGEIYKYQQKYRSADIAYTTAVHLEPGMALWWYKLGVVREALRDYLPAAEAFERSLKINPEYRDAAEALARVRRYLNR